MKLQGKHIINIILLLIIVVFLFKNCNQSKYNDNIINQYGDSLQTYKNKEGLNESKISELELTRKDLKKALDSVKINRRTETITLVKNQTRIKEVVKTIIEHDTIIKNGFIQTYPVYKSQINNFWYKANIEARHDTTLLDLIVYDEFIIRREQQRGLFKSKPIDIKVTHQNPKTQTTKLHSYKVKSKDPLFNIGLQLGAGIDVISKRPTIYLGGGIGVNLLR